MINYRIVSADEYTDNSRSKAIRELEIEVENTFAQIIRELLCPKKKEVKKVDRNEVDGSFVVRITDDGNFPELAQRLVDYASKNGLTIDPGVRKLQVEDGLSFGAGLDYDVKRVKGIHDAYQQKLEPIYQLCKDFEKILQAVKEMAAEKTSLSNDLKKSWATGKRAFIPTYNSLKREVVGGKLVDKKRTKSFEKECDKVVTPKSNIDRITVSQNFIKVGYDFIPINDNDLVYLSV